MFTGIVEEQGKLLQVKKAHPYWVFTIGAKKVLEHTVLGDSICTQGVCLTVSSMGDDYFSAHVMEETLTMSTLGNLKKGDALNLERALTLSKPLGGHILQGHVDGRGRITRIEHVKEQVHYYITLKPELLTYIVHKGSIAIDGISLTVSGITGIEVKVSLIPTTLRDTTLSFRKVGDEVNVETDILGKYIEKLMVKKEPLSFKDLEEMGF